MYRTAIAEIVNEQRTLLKRAGHPMQFIYLNYADNSQKVLQLGNENVAKLRDAS